MSDGHLIVIRQNAGKNVEHVWSTVFLGFLKVTVSNNYINNLSVCAKAGVFVLLCLRKVITLLFQCRRFSIRFWWKCIGISRDRDPQTRFWEFVHYVTLERIFLLRGEDKQYHKNRCTELHFTCWRKHIWTRADARSWNIFSSLFLAIEDELEHDSIVGTNDIEKREENLKETFRNKITKTKRKH